MQRHQIAHVNTTMTVPSDLSPDVMQHYSMFCVQMRKEMRQQRNALQRQADENATDCNGVVALIENTVQEQERRVLQAQALLNQLLTTTTIAQQMRDARISELEQQLTRRNQEYQTLTVQLRETESAKQKLEIKFKLSQTNATFFENKVRESESNKSKLIVSTNENYVKKLQHYVKLLDVEHNSAWNWFYPVKDSKTLMYNNAKIGITYWQKDSQGLFVQCNYLDESFNIFIPLTDISSPDLAIKIHQLHTLYQGVAQREKSASRACIVTPAPVLEASSYYVIPQPI